MIQIKNIVKNYLSGENEVHALKGVSINFRNSEFVSILGPSGCGKTTLLNIIGGLDKYTSGDIIINGTSTKEYKDKEWDAYRNHYIGFVFQSYNLINHLNILENVELALSIAGHSKSEKRKRAKKALKEVGLSDQLKKKPNQLSGGQMQRVAIARAIVNEPKIILADEPTGALDSETSVQIMEILKEISNKYLIIMVTHNEDIARDYSTRIISILDGEIKNDTNPFNPSEKEIFEDKISIEKKEIKDINRKKKKKIKSSMSYGTAFTLSLKNLWQKKGKTIIESLAGSIGIIGIALVLAVSSGFTNYINNLQTNTLGGFPLNVSMVAMNYDAIMNSEMQGIAGEDNTDDDSLAIYDSTAALGKIGHLNFFSNEFIDYIDDFIENDSKKSEDEQNIKHYQLDYGISMPLLTKSKLTTNVEVVTTVNTSVSTSAFNGKASSQFYEIIDNKEWILQNYDLIGNYASQPDEIMLVIGDDNKIDLTTVRALGLPYTTHEENGSIVYDNLTFQDIIDKSKYAIIFNDIYYDSLDDFSVIDLPDNKNTFTTADITAIYNNSQSLEEYNSASESTRSKRALELKISGILRVKEDAEIELLDKGLVYTSALRNLYVNDCKYSEIVKEAKNRIETNEANTTGDAIYNITLPWTYTLDVSELTMIGFPPFSYNTTAGMVSYIRNVLNRSITYEETYNLALQSVGASDYPVAMYFYPKSFDAKQSIIDYINEWNETEVGKQNKILYTDATEILTSSMGQMVDIISYVLIAFAGISLVVSSVMIGIITYTSVIERTKEIGVLRSIGARKKDISRIFNAETILIGLFAGLLGVFISWILTFPISSIIINVAGGAITTSMAILEFSDALTLVIISALLTTIAGTVPAYIASKKDPVKCLRSE